MLSINASLYININVYTGNMFIVYKMFMYKLYLYIRHKYVICAQFTLKRCGGLQWKTCLQLYSPSSISLTLNSQIQPTTTYVVL